MRFAADVRGRRAIGAVATVAAAAAAVGLAVPAMAAPAVPAARVLSGGQAAPRSAVPWRKVGPGWALAKYSASQGGEGVKPKVGPSTLYLVNPQGGRYKLVTWSARSPRAEWQLLAWSGDVSRALFGTFAGLYGTGREHVYQLQLRTGRVTGFTLPAKVTAVGYTRPAGLNILAEKWTSTTGTSNITVQRYSLTGKLQKDLATVKGLALQVGEAGIPPAPYNSKGTELAAGTMNGLELISNAGGVIRRLPVPGVKGGCAAVRWWSSATVLASCSVANEPGPRMWLVPASGARPTALTPIRTGPGFDFGDFNAWQLSSGLYVDGEGACGTLVIGRQPAHGNERQVNVPGSGSSLIVNATRSTLMVERINGCMPGISLVWFNPATQKMKVAIAVSHHQFGVTAVVPYFISGKF
jgi:TolB protein